MKGLNNEQLPEYVQLMRDIVGYLQTPTFINFYKKYDKKLTKNMAKRCIVEPFCDKIMKNTNGAGGGVASFEITRFKDQTHVFETMNKTFIQLNE
jgi:hypothetical protein